MVAIEPLNLMYRIDSSQLERFNTLNIESFACLFRYKTNLAYNKNTSYNLLRKCMCSPVSYASVWVNSHIVLVSCIIGVVLGPDH